MAIRWESCIMEKGSRKLDKEETKNEDLFNAP